MKFALFIEIEIENDADGLAVANHMVKAVGKIIQEQGATLNPPYQGNVTLVIEDAYVRVKSAVESTNPV